MHQIKNVLVNRILRINLKKRILLVTIFILSLFLIYTNNVPHESLNYEFNDKINENDFENIKNDLNVNTGNYFVDYNKYKDIKQTVKHKFKYIDNKDNRKLYTEFLILEYTKVFGYTRACHLYSDGAKVPIEDVFIKECPYKNCRFTCDKNQAAAAQAIIFHESDLKYDLKRDVNFMKQAESYRIKEKVWILWTDEANIVSSELDKYKFNWTMSYRLDSEIADCSYGCKYDLNNENMVRKKNIDDTIIIFFNLRKNKALWFVSNCDSKSRIEFALKLGKYFPIEIIGDCKYLFKIKNTFTFIANTYVGNLVSIGVNAVMNVLTGNTNNCKTNSLCEMTHMTGSKFYLSFESKNCSYYITEKFWRILRAGLIPIVFQPNKQFYEQIAPSNSFIHAQDFDYDVYKLANYMSLVSNDINYYMKHVYWRHEYDIVYSRKKSEARRFCELCTRLNTEKNHIYYESVSNFFKQDCIIN